MHTVAVRSEELKDSGRDLLLWVEYYLGPVAMYASVNNSNKIQITLPQTGKCSRKYYIALDEMLFSVQKH